MSTDSTVQKAGGARIPSLDGLRAVSISLVLIGHSRMSVAGEKADYGSIFELVGNHRLGVTIFFVLSGFLITRILLDEMNRTGTINLRDFYVKRIFRIFPVYYVFLFVVLGLWAAGSLTLSWHETMSSVFFIKNYYLNPGSWWLGHTWSLSLEEQFYLFWPATLLFFGPRNAKFFAWFVVLFSPMSRLGTFYAFEWLRGFTSTMTHTRLDSIMAGCLLALSYRDSVVWNWLNRMTVGWRVFVPLFFLFVGSPHIAKWTSRYMLGFGYSLEALAIVLLVFRSVEYPGGLLGRFLNWSPVVHVGVLSYSLYIWNPLFTGHADNIFSNNVVLTFCVPILVAQVSYSLVEKPFLRMRERFLSFRREERLNLSRPA